MEEYDKSKKYFDDIFQNTNCIEFSYKLFYSIYRLYKDGGINQDEYNSKILEIIKKDLKIAYIYPEIEDKSYKLYNYTKINKNTIRTILNEELWLSHPNTFNDPIDPAIKILNEKSNNDFKYLIDLLYIGCLSLTNDNSLMWSHYANKHEGICIEYDFQDFIKNKPNNTILKRVNYIEEIINDRNSILTGKNKDNSQDRLIDILSIKSKEWEYENEYRIIKYCKDSDSNTIKLPIKNIYFGAKTPQCDKDLLIKILSDKNIEFYESNFDDNIINKIIFTKI